MEDRNSKFETRNSRGTPSSQAKRRVRDFKDLDVWKAARELRRKIYNLAKSLPDSEKFGLSSQLRRAGVSVTANIAEGFGRFGYQENVQFCRLDGIAQRVTQLLNGYLRSTLSLKSASEIGKGRAEPQNEGDEQK